MVKIDPELGFHCDLQNTSMFKFLFKFNIVGSFNNQEKLKIKIVLMFDSKY